MTRQELLAELARLSDEDLAVALQAGRAREKARQRGTYFLHHFLQERRVEGEDGRAVITIPVSDLVMNPGGMVHGGITALLCDNAMGMASYMEKRRPGVTVEMTVRYHRPGRGDRLVASGEVLSAGALLNSARCEVRDEDGTLVATATGTFYHRQSR
ncbi:PaaI family thioesterase [Alicyclobacillus sp.]|uniref:PaaI family thioesterase n=1 Tax=Alicyclobacillus sp. TaxID=61169 RepID=UPI0025C2B90C|nr:PaaI family thioesterase [Alicyclobacillus sp.]MCL6515932.1 PaaI family thioesterase [Alicyclobacillus sp.]